MIPPAHIHTSITDISHAIDRSLKDEFFPVAKTPSEEENYFVTNPRPPYLDELINEAQEFIQYQHSQGRDKIVLVTSGGTTVPLENNTVRFIDNFSAGTRGAASAEQFLAHGYSVIFLHREFSLTPFNRKFTNNSNHLFLDYLEDDGTLKSKYMTEFKQNKELYDKYLEKERRLVMLPFTTVNQYLWSLKSIGKLMNFKGCLFYLAAAVSDFFVPHSKLPKHKIQSRDYGTNSTEDLKDTETNTTTTADGKLIVNLDPVPKFLSRLVSSWASRSMIVSFKLETDKSILIHKAQYALERYNHQLVIGNLLQTRSKEVVFVTPDQKDGYMINLDTHPEVTTIEELIIPEVINIHDSWIQH
ncbi:similar to Saccharomyces cerevisiae YIL083C CAB2 Probable phosphopantothenoylcysteine synthetase (PPCS), which catalyzes the second step of coenzyme A biosynthesis from pantothenate [Maudiozyma saulgeensis]|uniref:Similar to Saccharomyces cerevisiae YIL083C CAB2 Probable phosphopantothenoylcysteine synthetase (PPCS), which catalyzes the second step of coenzyme A biosynthesis from pantothenate n=1 Tax=Maudiozyma saulgeensis TaxID=1789683 RepID=A0A1X7R9C6_9SACH|nr:similar to Saccharomyces cerevisiae YIL083C CAB2 Probable phosphopantothenoylcysteine synthetase (PPCS), which catalyzes the second step of coenzyme A biosynthesis from pantothenate [Kazachstania saulgeensis]